MCPLGDAFDVGSSQNFAGTTPLIIHRLSSLATSRAPFPLPDTLRNPAGPDVVLGVRSEILRFVERERLPPPKALLSYLIFYPLPLPHLLAIELFGWRRLTKGSG